MLQDIKPHKLNNAYTPRNASDSDYLLIFKENQALISVQDDNIMIPSLGELKQHYEIEPDTFIYLFNIDGCSFYLLNYSVAETSYYKYHSIQIFRNFHDSWLGFAGVTGSHLANWYDTHRYCGRCANAMLHSENERSLFCPKCDLVEYPNISPAIIVGILDGDKILLTRYANSSYKKYSLVAGFTEIGETLEQTVKREVMEETGLRVTNLRYYRNQPWGFSSSILVGFFADVKESREVHLDTNELSEAHWFKREDIPTRGSSLSLTQTMIEAFRNHDFPAW